MESVKVHILKENSDYIHIEKNKILYILVKKNVNQNILHFYHVIFYSLILLL